MSLIRNVIIQEEYHPPSDLYLYQLVVTPTITVTVVLHSKTITVDSNSGVINGHAITIYEGRRVFQSIIQSSTATSITVASPIDHEFTSSATVETGIWNMAVDGSVTSQEFCVKPPLADCDLCIHQVNIDITDGTAMDSAKFGGIPALTNGLVMQYLTDYHKHLSVIVNNMGFWEYGFRTEYDDKAPAGVFGFRAKKLLMESNGTSYLLKKSENGFFKLIVQDDLTGLTLMACCINGHKVRC